ncbi:MAG: type II toxin-antitoxin system VapC family toxin [Candidatus Brocadiia bacterium]
MSNVYLLDTNIASALWDELHPNYTAFRERVARLRGSRVYVSVISLAEVEYGLKTAPRVDEERQDKVRANMRRFQVLPLTHHVVEYYAELRARLFRKHSPRNKRGRLAAKVLPDLWERTPDKLLGIQENDLWIASLALERNLVLITNERMTHIRSVAADDLRIELWD